MNDRSDKENANFYGGVLHSLIKKSGGHLVIKKEDLPPGPWTIFWVVSDDRIEFFTDAGRKQ